MGKIFSKKVGKKQILMIGLDNAGKTTILYQLMGRMDEDMATAPTIGSNIETITYKNITLRITDMGGKKGARNLWVHDFATSDAIIFVIDCSDKDRIKEAKKEIRTVVEHEQLRPRVPLLFFANKQDVEGRLEDEEINKKLGLNNIDPERWFCQGTVATNPEDKGISTGLDWLADRLKKQNLKSSKKKKGK
eukprot:TRINITY_DN4153_c0_g1_i1.p1 TRINITY_DN4153_c0_g1~~TRINITY_DN4153_c0_g1_i1.p1  ORF type:complete len:209 (-),score=39.83 TRINITY_DN4153_c0_g1_i1:166-738(-)